MTYHRRYEQNDNQGRQQPSRTNDKRTWECQINSGDRQEREQRLPAWLRFIDASMMIVRHKSGIAGIMRCASAADVMLARNDHFQNARKISSREAAESR